MVSGLLAIMVVSAPARADSYQIGNDTGSDGWYPNQPALSPAAVGGGSFGNLFNTLLDGGKIYAQPLVDQGQVLAVTENDNAYGVSTVTGRVTWTMNYGPVAAPADNPTNNAACGDIGSSVGITGTPVIDPSTNIAYFVAARATGPVRNWPGISTQDAVASTQYYLEAASVLTGQPPVGWPAGGVLISGNNDANTASFVSDYETQRPGLVLVKGVVYAAFSAQCDFIPSGGTYTGWVVGISTTTDAVTTMWASETSGNNGGGIWQSGGAPVVDANGNIYVVTGNSFSSNILPPAGSNGLGTLTNYGEAVVELSTANSQLTPVDWFIPAGAATLDTYDLDFSSGGPVELPASMGTPQQPNVLLGVGKNAILYSLDMSHLGGYEHGPNGGDAVPSELALSGGVWDRPAVWPGDGGYIYLPTTGSPGQQTGGTFNAYQRVVSASGAVGFQLVGTAANFGYSSGSPVVTSNGMNSGSALVWTIRTNGSSGVGGQLDAFDPIPQNPGSSGTLALVWSSSANPAFSSEKYTSPGIGNGAVYVGTQDGHLLGFGFSTLTAPVTGSSVNFSPTVVSQSTASSATFTATTATTVTSFSVSGSPFVLGSPSAALPATLQPGDSISVPISFTPNSIGLNGGTVSANTSTGGILSATTVTLSGMGEASSSIVAASPSAVNFGVQPIGGGAITQQVTMTNNSPSTIQITGFTPPVNSTPFVISGAPPTGALASGNSVTFDVTFTPPGSSGSYTHVFGDVATLETNVGNFGVPLSGGAAPPAVLAIIPISLNFNDVQVGQTSSLTFDVEDNGGLPLTIASSSPPALGVGITAVTTLPVGTIVGANSTVQETVKFTPTSPGAVTDSWVISGNDGNPPATLVIRGTGVQNLPGPPIISTATAANAQATVTWTAPTDNGGAPISGFTATALDTTHGANGGQSCSAPGPSATQCVVTGLTNGDQYTFTVTATNSVGTGPPSNASNPVTPEAPGKLTVVPTSLTFGNVQVGSSATLSFVVQNDGNGPLTITSVTPPHNGPFVALTTLAVNTVIAANSSVSETVKFVPTSVGPASDAWVISSNDGSGPLIFSLTGEGITVTLPPQSAPPPVHSNTSPGPPIISTATAANAQATVTWTAPTDNGGAPISGFTATALDTTHGANGGQSCSAPGPSATQCVVTGLTNGDQYTFTVTATNSVGTGPPSNASNPVTPEAPGKLTVVPSAPVLESLIAGDSVVQITWRPPSFDGGSAITGFRVLSTDLTRFSRGGQYCSVSGSSGTHCLVKGLTNGDRYDFTVTAINAVGRSLFSNPSFVITPSAPSLSIVSHVTNLKLSLSVMTKGDELGGALTYFALDGSAFGCRTAQNMVLATTGGTCVLVAHRAATNFEPAVTSPSTLIVVPGDHPIGHSVFVSVTFSDGGKTVSVLARRLLQRVINTWTPGSLVVVTGYAPRNMTLARVRADVIARLFSPRYRVRVRGVDAPSAAANIVMVNEIVG